MSNPKRRGLTTYPSASNLDFSSSDDPIQILPKPALTLSARTAARKIETASCQINTKGLDLLEIFYKSYSSSTGLVSHKFRKTERCI
jgi:hypothetical protein